MSEGATNRIWRPLVKPTDVAVPSPGTSSTNQTQQLYTKTLLAAEQGSRERILNREILSASQSYNNTPKPFSRAHISNPSSSTFERTSEQEARPSCSSAHDSRYNSEKQQVESNQQESTRTSTAEKLSEVETRGQQEIQEENMAPKLVHKQYNSPIDLYSMNNIRKTIEAHTEFIAPGLKGINFMKADAPVNKQSEVYKLVMEEEGQRTRQGLACLSPTIGQSVSIANEIVEQQQQCHHHNYNQQAQTNVRLASKQTSPHHLTSASSDSCKQYHKVVQQQLIESQRALETSGAPACLACGQSIKGLFAKIQDRCIHPQCFNCSTCGTSLKNTGHFTVNEKLYCYIHAKQVADMMHIKHNFDEKQASQEFSAKQSQSTTLSRQQRYELGIDQQESAPSNANKLIRLSGSNETNPATISTMFADRGDNDKAGSDGKVKWSWRPVTSKDVFSSASSAMHTTGPTTTSSLYQRRQREAGELNLPATGASLSSYPPLQSTLHSLGSQSQGFLRQENTLADGRVPICTHCHVQIRGPYILAGKTIWCKLCSQSHFKCSSCSRSLLNIGFIEDNSQKYFCEHCFEAYHAPICSKCNIRIKGDCLNALSKKWHPSCFICGHCQRPFGNSSFYLEDNVPYCERDWNLLFTTKCYSCSYPIGAGDKWIEALERSYHLNCFKCTSCQANLEGLTFYCKGGKPYCRQHASR